MAEVAGASGASYCVGVVRHEGRALVTPSPSRLFTANLPSLLGLVLGFLPHDADQIR